VTMAVFPPRFGMSFGVQRVAIRDLLAMLNDA
jgi:hypothetical protein